MIRQVLFIQGAGEGAHAEDAELAENLRSALGADYEVRYPPMPNEGDPDDAAWGERIAAEVDRVGDSLILVGHSAGAVSLLSFLARGGLAKGKVAGIFLVGAPFFGTGGWHVEGFALPNDLGRRLPDAPVFLFHGSDDQTAPVAHVALYAKAVPHAVVHRLEGRDHQLNGDMSEVAREIRSLA